MPEVEITVTQNLSPDVMAGLHLYRDLVRPGFPDQAVEDLWCYWFRENPFGPGFFAVARDGSRVVGFHSYIPVEMQFGDRFVPGGRGEFFAVHPDYRKTPATAGKTLPLALISGLKEEAFSLGLKSSFGTSRKGAAFLTTLTGAKPISVDSTSYLAFFNPASGARRVKDHALILASRLLRAAGRMGARRGRSAHYDVRLATKISTAHSGAGGDHVNRLVSERSTMLNFRFPPHWHVIYEIRERDREAAYLVFTKPRQGAVAHLAYWSRLDLPLGAWGAVLDDVSAHCKRERAARLLVALPAKGSPPVNLPRLGYPAKRLESDVFVTCADQDLARLRDTLPWIFNNAHINWFSFC